MPQEPTPPATRLRDLAAAAAAASHALDYGAAVTHARAALDLARLEPASSPSLWDERLAVLDLAELPAVAQAATALAICTFRQGDYMTSLGVAQFELHVRQYLGDEAGAAKATLGLGWCYHVVGLYQQALACQFEALDALERLEPVAVAGPLNGVARVYLDLGQVDLALEYAKRALSHAPRGPNGRRDRSTALRTVGQAHMALNDFASARRVFQESYDHSDPYGRRLARLSLGSLSLEVGLLDEAEEHFEESLVTLSPEMRELVRAEALLGLGKVWMRRGEPERALVPISEAIARSSASGSPVEAAAAHQAMSGALAALGRFEEALEHHRAFHELNDRTLRQLSDHRTQILQVQLDVERMRKDREIDRLRNVELARAYADLSHLHQQLKAQAARLELLTRTDDLTGVANRRAFDERLSAEVLRAHRMSHPLSILMLDLDDFKRVNDTYSHAVGDAALRSTAEALLGCTREVDLVARIGGEEFVVLMPETTLQGAELVAKKVLAEVLLRTEQATGVAISASAGVAALEPFDDGASLLSRSDANLYEAKRGGKNRVTA